VCLTRHIDCNPADHEMNHRHREHHYLGEDTSWTFG
jgi:hypothetical protein